MPKVKKAELERLQAAEDVCYTLILMMHIGLLEGGPFEHLDVRTMLGEPMEKWSNLAMPKKVEDAESPLLDSE